MRLINERPHGRINTLLSVVFVAAAGVLLIPGARAVTKVQDPQEKKIQRKIQKLERKMEKLDVELQKLRAARGARRGGFSLDVARELPADQEPKATRRRVRVRGSARPAPWCMRRPRPTKGTTSFRCGTCWPTGSRRSPGWRCGISRRGLARRRAS